MRLLSLWVTSCVLGFSSVTVQAEATSQLLFAGKSQALGVQLWQTDHSAMNTKIFSYLSQIPNADSNYYPLGSVGQYGLFAAFTPETGQELWRTDGSSVGTSLVKELAPGALSGLPKMHELYTETSINLKERLLFWGQTAEHLTLYSTDGSSENTQALAEFPRSGTQSLNLNPPNFYTLQDQAFFWIDDGVHSLELWKTDGTMAGTQLALDASEESADFSSVLAYGNPPISNQTSLFFISADKRSSSAEEKLDYSLWRVDGKTTERLVQFSKQPVFSYNLMAANAEKVVWSKINETDQQPELWQLDLKTKQTSLILHLPAAKQGSRSLTNIPALFFKGKLFFWTYLMQDYQIEELWVTDFTAKGTESLVSLPNPNNEYKAAPLLFSFADRLYFFLSDGIRPAELWLTDGSVAGTKNLLKVKDSMYAGGAGDSWPARPLPYVLLADKLIFPTFAPRDCNYSQLWSLTSEQPEQPMLLGEFADPQLLPPNKYKPSQFVYFLSGKERWQTDGTLAGTKSLGADAIRKQWQATEWPSGGLTEILPLPSEAPQWLMVERDEQAGKEPWLIAAEPAQTKVLKDINTSAASADLKQVHQLGDHCYFVLNSRLWVTQLDPQTAHELTEIPKEESFSFNALSVVKQQASLYFITENTEKTNSLWQINAGQVKRLKTFPKDGYIWLFPSTQGVYVAYYPSGRTASWSLELWQAKEQQFVNILKEGTDQRRLAAMLETEQGLLYILEPNYRANINQPSLMLHPKTGSDLVLKKAFEPVPNLLTETVFNTAQQTYFLEQKPNDPLNYQLSKLNWSKKQLVSVKTPALPQQSRILAASKGLFILSQEPEAHLWWLADDTEQPSLIKKLDTYQYVDTVKVLADRLYFQTAQPADDYDLHALWISDATPAGTKKLSDDLEMGKD